MLGLKFLPSTPMLMAVAFVAGLAVGGWTAYKIVRAGEVKALQSTIREMQSNRAAADKKAAETVSVYMLAVEEGHRKNRVLQRRLRDAIKDDPVCDYSADVVGMLNRARFGLPETPSQPVTETPPAGTLSTRQAAGYWADDIAAYEACRAQLNSLIDWHR